MFATSFRNTLIASTLLVGASLLAGPAAMAAEDTDTVTGTVSTVTSVNFVGTGGTITPGVAVPAFTMGDLTIQNNTAGTWNLTVSSLNAGNLENAGGTVSIPYTNLDVADIGGIDFTAVASPSVAAQDLALAAPFNTTVAGGATSAVTASISAAASSVQADVYTDSLTFTLTAN